MFSFSDLLVMENSVVKVNSYCRVMSVEGDGLLSNISVSHILKKRSSALLQDLCDRRTKPMEPYRSGIARSAPLRITRVRSIGRSLYQLYPYPLSSSTCFQTWTRGSILCKLHSSSRLLRSKSILCLSSHCDDELKSTPNT